MIKYVVIWILTTQTVGECSWNQPDEFGVGNSSGISCAAMHYGTPITEEKRKEFVHRDSAMAFLKRGQRQVKQNKENWTMPYTTQMTSITIDSLKID